MRLDNEETKKADEYAKAIAEVERAQAAYDALEAQYLQVAEPLNASLAEAQKALNTARFQAKIAALITGPLAGLTVQYVEDMAGLLYFRVLGSPAKTIDSRLFIWTEDNNQTVWSVEVGQLAVHGRGATPEKALEDLHERAVARRAGLDLLLADLNDIL